MHISRLARATLAPAAAVALALGGAAAPAAASGPAGALDSGASTSVAPLAFQNVRVNVNPPAGTYANVRYDSRPGGIYIDFVKFSGVMRANACIRADLVRNGVSYRRTVTKCFRRGTRVTATFQVDAFQPIGTRFVTRWVGAGSPAGTETFRVVRA